jgi:hypothetical protein
MTSKIPASGTTGLARAIFMKKKTSDITKVQTRPDLRGSCYITSGTKASSRGHTLQLHNSYHIELPASASTAEENLRMYYYASNGYFFLFFLFCSS